MASLYPHLIAAIGSSATDAASYTTASWTPVSGRPSFIAVASAFATAPNTPTATGTNGWNTTFTAVNNSVQDGIKITVFRVVPVSSVAGTITFDFSAQTQTGAAWIGIDVVNAVSSGFAVQSATGAVDNATSLTPTALAAFASSFNGTLCFAACSGNLTTVRGSNTQGLMLQIPVGSSGVAEAAGPAICAFFAPTEVSQPAVAVSGAGSDIVAVTIEVGHDGSGISAGSSNAAVPTFRVF